MKETTLLCFYAAEKKVSFIIPPLQWSWKGCILVSRCPPVRSSVRLSIRLWTESCPFCIFHNTSRNHFIFSYLIYQLHKVYRMLRLWQNSTRPTLDADKPSATLQYIPRNMHTVFALLCFVVVIHWLFFPYPSGLLHWHCGNLTIAPVPAKQPWWISINT